MRLVTSSKSFDRPRGSKLSKESESDDAFVASSLCWGIVRVARGGDDDEDGENASTDDDVTVNIAAMTCSDFFMMIGIMVANTDGYK